MGVSRVDPVRAVQRRRSCTRDHATALRPQPRGDGPVAQRRLTSCSARTRRGRSAGIPRRVRDSCGHARRPRFRPRLPSCRRLPSGHRHSARLDVTRTKTRVSGCSSVNLAEGERTAGALEPEVAQGTAACTPRGSRSSGRATAISGASSGTTSPSVGSTHSCLSRIPAAHGVLGADVVVGRPAAGWCAPLPARRPACACTAASGCRPASP